MSKLFRFGWNAAVFALVWGVLGRSDSAIAAAQRIRPSDSQLPYAPPPASPALFPQSGALAPTGFPQSTLPQSLPPIQPPAFSQSAPAPGFGAPGTLSPPLMQLPANSAPPALGPTGFDAYGGVPPSFSGSPWPQAGGNSGVMIYPPANAYPWVGADGGAGSQPLFAPNGNPGIYGPTNGPGNPYLNNSQASGAWPNNPGAWPSQAWSRFRNEWLPRLIEHPRFRHTYLYGDDGNDLQIHDTELATTLTFPTFLMSRQPLRVSPGFIFHFWDGPDTALTGVDLPAQAYSAFLATDFISPVNQPMGIEVNFTVGMYTDFQHITTDSLRLTGFGVGWLRLNNTTTLKFGAEYLDRLDIKLLPAAGIFMMPSSDVKLDLFFPRPKFAWRLPNNLNLDAWFYLGGEYGGGSWTIERLGGLGDQVDINDIRVFVGSEWLGRRGVSGFTEIGYVFERELVYRSLLDPVPISDTFMIRMGLAF